MTPIIRRSACLAWGQTPPPDLAWIILNEQPGQRRVVTWKDVMAQRRERQREILARKRTGLELHAYRLRVAFYDQDLFGGWQAFLETYTGKEVWVDRHGGYPLRQTLFTTYPLVLPYGDPWRPQWPAWEQWKVAFAQCYTRRHQARKPVGVTYVWWDGAHDLRHLAAAGA